MARFVNKRLVFSVLFKWLSTVGFSEPIVWTFLPTSLSIDLIDKVGPKVLIYYCIDYFQASSNDARKIKDSEERLLKKADIVFVTSEELRNYCLGHNKNVHYFPFGVNIENFRKTAKERRDVPDDIRNIKRPIAGYIGGVHKWIDFELVGRMARENKDISFVFCGPIQEDISRFRDTPNVVFLGQKRTEDLPLYVKEFDVALIPYRVTEYTNNVYPTKMNEYLSMGKRVVSTNLLEVGKFNKENGPIVRVAKSAEEFCGAVRRAVDEPGDRNEEAAAISAAEKNSWSVKLEKMSGLIWSLVSEKAKERELSWKANLVRLYRKTGSKVVPVAIAAALIYAAVFYTPLLWFIASPLEIVDIPQKADVIAVMGGGVGESGKAGEGYQERVQSAVAMYDARLSDNILFLSGYMYLMKEAYVMRTLSIALGVPPGKILLDDKPVNTYDMVKALEALCRTKGWRSAIIVSSPYHMLRLKLLCEKHLKGLVIYYVPVDISTYYSRGVAVSPKQIEGVMKEYAAILYYLFKGYI
jgi:uncharacterized SAM-binding protein YcdF (DUF218 family)